MKALVLIYIFTFACLLKMHATGPIPKVQQQPKDCVKHPIIVKSNTIDKPKVATEKIARAPLNKGGNSVPYFSVLNFINFFYTKDTLDNLHVM